MRFQYLRNKCIHGRCLTVCKYVGSGSATLYVQNKMKEYIVSKGSERKVYFKKRIIRMYEGLL